MSADQTTTWSRCVDARARREVAEPDPEHAVAIAPQPSRRTPPRDRPRRRAPTATRPISDAARSARGPSAAAARPRTRAMPTRIADPRDARARRCGSRPSEPVDHCSRPRPLAVAAACAGRSSERMSTSAPTKSTTSPWISSVRFDASSGRKISGSRLRVDVPGRRARANSSAGEADADRLVAAEQRDGDPDEGDLRRDHARRSC